MLTLFLYMFLQPCLRESSCYNQKVWSYVLQTMLPQQCQGNWVHQGLFPILLSWPLLQLCSCDSWKISDRASSLLCCFRLYWVLVFLFSNFRIGMCIIARVDAHLLTVDCREPRLEPKHISRTLEAVLTQVSHSIKALVKMQTGGGGWIFLKPYLSRNGKKNYA